MSRTAIPRAASCLSSRRSLLASSRAIESPCRSFTLIRAAPSQCPSQTIRSFSLSSPLQKKAGKANKAHARTDSTPPVNNAGAATPTDEAYDVSGLESQILKAIEKLTHDLSQLRGGREIESRGCGEPERAIRHKGRPGRPWEGECTVRRHRTGRTERESAERCLWRRSVPLPPRHTPSPLSPLNPATPLTIQVPMPPPTGESRRAAVDSAVKASERADKWIQTARQEHNKKLRKYELNRDVLPDDLQKAKKRMEEVVKKGHGEVKRISDGAKRVLESL
ncbi:ribosome-recycling factor [Neocucurbitaria cava]|uniref:Ribosome-recycling factor n=1 Tax=Neocucurbitaria cava TaxID=798079 RepID=A0A9W9CMM2_9PLEO|nr:ribosome-recycling factor [Neocucurbitaria cava]